MELKGQCDVSLSLTETDSNNNCNSRNIKLDLEIISQSGCTGPFTIEVTGNTSVGPFSNIMLNQLVELNQLKSGPYYFEICDANGLCDIEFIEIEFMANNGSMGSCPLDPDVPCNILIDLTTTPLTACGADDGTVTSTIVYLINTGGSVLYSLDGVGSMNNNNTGSFTNLAPGSYTLYAWDSNDQTCSSSYNFVISDFSPSCGGCTVTAATIAADETICLGESASSISSNVAPSGSPNLTHQWQSSTTSSTSGFGDVSGEMGTSISPGMLTQTSYYRLITNSDASGGCADTSNIVTVTVLSNARSTVDDVLCPGESVVVGGMTFDELSPSGMVTITDGATNGCDSIVTVSLTYLMNATSTVEDVLCPGESVVVGGMTFDEVTPSGMVTITDGATNGCDSIVTVSLTYLMNATSTVEDVLCPGESVVVGGMTFDEVSPSGMVTITDGATNGCDSIVTVSLTYLMNATSTVEDVLCPGESVVVGGMTFDEVTPSGMVTITDGATNGCDSIVTVSLTYLMNATSTVEDVLCPGESVVVGGMTFDEVTPSGMVTITDGATNGCDSIVTVSLTYLMNATSTVEDVLCPGESVVVGGMTFDEVTPSGMVTITDGATNGCDSIVTVSLTYLMNATSTVEDVLCPGESVVVGGMTFDEVTPSGMVTITDGATNGCDSIVTVSLTYLMNATSTVEDVLCPGESVVVGGMTFDEVTPSGMVTITDGATNGCDSIVTVSLTYLMNATSTVEDVLCPGESVVVGGMTFDEVTPSGMVTITDGATNGCDSIVTVSLTYLMNATSTVEDVLCPGESVVVGGMTFDEVTPSGMVTITDGATNGCDSIVTVSLTYLMNATSTVEDVLCPGESVVVGGMTFDEVTPSGMVTITDGATNGCDSIVTVSLTYLMNATSTVEDVLCPGESVVVGGMTFDEVTPSGMVTITDGATNGCDSIVTVSLTYLMNATSTVEDVLCPGESVVVGGMTFDEVTPSGMVTITDGATNGCDSIVTVSLTYLMNATSTVEDVLCPGESVVVGGMTFDEVTPSGMVTITDGATNGCDSIVTVSLTYLMNATSTVEDVLCPGESVVVGGMTFDEVTPSGMVTITDGATNGCDSIVTVSLTYLMNATSTVEDVLCPGESVVVGGMTFDEVTPSGMVTITDGATNGCDSIVTVSLTYLMNATSTVEDVLCPGESVVVGGMTFDEVTPSGMVTITDGATNGCDSIVTVSLMYLDTSSTIIDTLICQGEMIVFNDMLIVSGGSYRDTLTNTVMCDSFVTLNVTVKDVNIPSIPDTSICVGQDIFIDLLAFAPVTTHVALLEDFEDASINYTTSTPEFSDGEMDYFIRTNGSNITGETFLGIQGASYFAAQDIDGEVASSNQTLTFSGIDISGLTNLQLSVFLAEDDASDGMEDWDNSDFVHIYYSIDGGSIQNLIWIENNGSGINQEPQIDTDFDGVGDGAAITSTFTQYIASIMSRGSLLTLTIEFNLNDGDTDIAIDNVMITGESMGEAMCSYNVYDRDPALMGSTKLLDEVTSLTINSISADSTIYITKVESGCESEADIVNITVRDTSTTTIDSTICMGEVIDFNGQMITTSGTYRDTLTNAAMCDSFINLVVTVNPLPVLNEVRDTFCQGENGSIDLTDYESDITTATGSFSYSKRETTRPMELFISEYIEGNSNNKCIELYNGTGSPVNLSDYTLEFYSNGNATSTTSISLTGLLADNGVYVICDVDADASFLIEADQTSSSSFYNGNDAVALLNGSSTVDVIGQIGFDPVSEWGSGLTSTENNTLVRNPDILTGDTDGSDAFDPSLDWMGFVIDEISDLGSHTINLPISKSTTASTVNVSDGDEFCVVFTDMTTGCIDSTVLSFVVKDTSSIIIDSMICMGEMVEFNGSVINTSGSYRDTLTNTMMCDSFITLNVIVLDTSTTIIDSRICMGELIEFNNQLISTAGTYRDTLQNVAKCDSFVTLNVLVIDTSSAVIDSTICLGDAIEFNDQMISMAGTYRDTLTNSGMCDSFITLIVTVLDKPMVLVDSTICEGELIMWNGDLIGEDGVYPDTLTTGLGCDSIVNLNLQTINCNTCIISLEPLEPLCSSDGKITFRSRIFYNEPVSSSINVLYNTDIIDTLPIEDLNNGDTISYEVLPEQSLDSVSLMVIDSSLYPVYFFTPYFSEWHYDNVGEDTLEFFEITAPAGVNLENYTVSVYDMDGLIDATLKLSGVVPVQEGNCGAVSFYKRDIVEQASQYFENSTNAIALYDGVTGDLLDFISVEGSILALEGAAINQTSVNIGDESGTTPVSYSLQLSDLGWESPSISTPNELNPNLSCSTLDMVKSCFAVNVFDIPVCQVDTFDMAIKKSVIDGETFDLGDTIAYAIEVFNQGNVTAFDIIIKDYVPEGLIYEQDINEDKWTIDTTYNMIDSIKAGESAVVTIYLILDEAYTGSGPLINSAEIISATTASGNLSDIDNPLSEIGGGTQEIDDLVDDNLVSDGQDDFDRASIFLCGSIRFTTPIVNDISICDPGFRDVVTIEPSAMQLPADLFFSEYIEGPSGLNNKCLEIYNGTGQNVDLTDYVIHLYNTDPRLDPDRSLNLSGTLIEGDVLVLCNNSTFSTEVDLVDADILAFNGDDIITLTRNGGVVDAIGQIGFDPGAQWNANGVSTMDQTLRRKPSIVEGDRNPNDLFVTDSEWSSLGDNVNDPSGLGEHMIMPPIVNSFTFYNDDPLTGGNVIAERVPSLDTMVSIDNSPINLWVATQPAQTNCTSAAVPVTIAVRSQSSSMTCLGAVNVNLNGNCSIADLPVSSFYRGTINLIFLSVKYTTESGLLVDPTDLSGYRGDRLTYEILDTCSQALCWGYVNIESKNIPDPLIIQSDTICCADDVTGAIRFTTDQVLDSLESICYASIINIIEEFTETVSDLCDTSVTEVRYYADFIIKEVKERHLVYAQDIYRLPISIDSILSPGSSNFLDSLALIDTIVIQACGQMDLTPSNVAHYWAELIDPEDANDNGDMEGIPYAYPYLLKDSTIVMDTTTTISEVDVIIEDSLVMIDGIWTVLDVIDHTFDTTTTISTRVIYDYQKISPDRTCNIIVKYTDHSKDSCYPDGKIFRKWTLIDWCSKEVRELEQWIIVDDIEPPVFGVLPVDIVLLGFDSAIVNGLDTVPIDSIGSLVNVDELFEIIYVSDGFECDAELDMPTFSKLEDNCTDVGDLQFDYQLSGTPANVSEDGLTIQDIPIGINELGITAIDQCGNSAEHNMTIIVLDAAPPIAQCREAIRVSYVHDDDGIFNRLPLEIIDAGSYDVCGEIILRLGKRLDNKIFCEDSLLTFIGTEYIEYCCEDIGSEIPVELTVFDNFGNTAVCTTYVLVEDKSESEVFCQELWLDCDDIPTREQLLDVLDLRLSNCATEDITFDDIMGSGSCGGTSEIVGVYLDGDKVCDLEVHYNTGQIFDPLSIKWPVHRDGSFGNGTVRECMDQDGLGQISRMTDRIYHHDALICDDDYDLTIPSWCESQCNLIGLSYEMTSLIQSSACKNDIIDWTIIDWCVYMPQQIDRNDDQLELVDDYWLDQSDAESQGLWLAQLEDGDSCSICDRYTNFPESIYYRYRDVEQDGYYSYRQIVRVSDRTQPIITIIGNDSTIILNPEFCTYSSSITARADDYCDSELILNSNLSWKVLIVGFDINLDQILEDSIHYMGNEVTVDLSGETNIAFYDIEWAVTDACGNTARSFSNVQLIDESVDAPICISSISLGVINDRIVLTAQDLSISTIDDCDEVSILGLSLDQSNELIQEQLLLECTDLKGSDSINLRLWVQDSNGNRNYCLITVFYQLSDNCDESTRPISGMIHTIFNQSMAQVEVNLIDDKEAVLATTRTDDLGNYKLAPPRSDGAYLRVDNPVHSLAGVSTLDIIMLQHHILGINSIKNPYLQWAGDINQDGRLSGIDISLMKKTLLGVDENTEVGKWKFMDARTSMIDLPNDLVQSEHNQIIYHTNRDQYNFLGVKMGDVSGDSYDRNKRSNVNVTVPIPYEYYYDPNELSYMLELTLTLERGLAAIEMHAKGEQYSGLDFALIQNPLNEDDLHQDREGAKLIWINSDLNDQSDYSIRIKLNTNRAFQNEILDELLQNMSFSIWDYEYTEYRGALNPTYDLHHVEVIVSPNPFVDQAILSINGLEGYPYELLIINAAGQIVDQFSATKKELRTVHKLSKEDLNESGVYYYQLKIKNSYQVGQFIMSY